MANFNVGRVGDSVIQPGRADGGRNTADRIALLSRWIPVNFEGAPNYVDAAFGWAWHQRIRAEQYYLLGGSLAY